jgi:hypothetical protein
MVFSRVERGGLFITAVKLGDLKLVLRHEARVVHVFMLVGLDGLL